jgi:adenylyltransferase/sulfurtransferase
VPLVWGVVQEFHAQVTVFWSRPPAGREPVVLADLHPPDQAGEAPSCAAVGVLGALTMQVGSLLAAEAVKLITGVGEPLLGRVLLIDALQGRTTDVPLHSASAAASPAAPTPAGPAPAPAAPEPIPHVTAAEMLAAQADEAATLLDVREPWETDAGIVRDSVLIPLGTFLADPSALEADGPVVVICAHGIRALQAAETLRARGVDARVLAGGLAAWS